MHPREYNGSLQFRREIQLSSYCKESCSLQLRVLLRRLSSLADWIPHGIYRELFANRVSDINFGDVCKAQRKDNYICQFRSYFRPFVIVSSSLSGRCAIKPEKRLE